MSSTNPRKRAAPGAAPIIPVQQQQQHQQAQQQQQQMQQPYLGGNPSADQLMRWNMAGDGTNYVPNNGYDLLQPGMQLPQAVPAAGQSTSLTRRQGNRALVPTNTLNNYNTAVEPWTGVGDHDVSLLSGDQGENIPAQDNIEVLEEMAQKAKRDAQHKRKQIPPFVQKLSSFLEEQKNTDLIRWSEKGDSFIVLDEDEFAKTLIPELFKHNNYASFVRQLNMYGFHKRVGLSDNSMRASERKNKSPSEYSNPYFRRGHPNLLWLINKPRSKSKKSGAKGGDGEGDSDEEPGQDETPNQGHGPSPTDNTARSLPSAGDSQPLQKKEMTVIREELHKLRDQQKMIMTAISRLQRNNNDLYNQALMFQNQHDRHQNSINAILNFLANVFRKTLEDQGSTQNVGDIISSMLTSQGAQASHQGNVVDLGDFFQSQAGQSPAMGGPPKRARGLLPPIPDSSNSPQTSTTRAQSTRSPSSGATPYYSSGSHQPQTSQVTELFDGQSGDTPPNLRQELENNPHERMMKIINDHNATNNSGLDLPEAAELVANTPNTLNNDQRSKLVNFMASQSPPGESTPAVAPIDTPKTATPAPTTKAVSPRLPDSSTVPSLSPIMRSPPMQPPSLNEINTNQMDLEALQRLQSEQEAKISELGDLLGPLSPSGHIPGLDGTDVPYFDQSNLDLDQYLDSNAFLNDGSFDGTGNDFNFNLDSHPDGLSYPMDGGQGGDDTNNNNENNNTPSPTGTEEIEREDFDVNGNDSASKRRRVR